MASAVIPLPLGVPVDHFRNIPRWADSDTDWDDEDYSILTPREHERVLAALHDYRGGYATLSEQAMVLKWAHRARANQILLGLVLEREIVLYAETDKIRFGLALTLFPRG